MIAIDRGFGPEDREPFEPPLRRGGFLRCQRFNVLRPQLKSLSHFLGVTVPLIDSGNATESSTWVVQCSALRKLSQLLIGASRLTGDCFPPQKSSIGRGGTGSPPRSTFGEVPFFGAVPGSEAALRPERCPTTLAVSRSNAA